MDRDQHGACIVARVIVRWGECDPAGIAYYPRMFEWMDLASHTLAREMGLSAETMLPPTLWGMPLVSAHAEFVAPAKMDDAVEVRAWVTRVGSTSFGLRHEIVRVDSDGETLLARGREERVHIRRDEAGNMRPHKLTPEMRATLERYPDPRVAEKAKR